MLNLKNANYNKDMFKVIKKCLNEGFILDAKCFEEIYKFSRFIPRGNKKTDSKANIIN
jgi:hypothetical protein